MKLPVKINFWLIIILIIAAILRFGGLTWCFPFAPHPDEWNMAAAITRLNWKDKLYPDFFAYGQFPLYLSFFSAKLYNLIPWIKLEEINLSEAIFFLRFWSAAAGVGTVYLVYLISRRISLTSPTSLKPLILLFPALLASFTPGLIQISHFGTTESLLSFFFLLVLLLSLKILEKQKIKYYLFLGTTLGLAVGTKISALTFVFPVFLVFLINLKNVFFSKSILKNFANLLVKNLIFLVFLVLFGLLSSPYLVLAFEKSRGTLTYETSVATGESAVFYTRQFLDTIPVLFQIENIFPYALGWPIFILGSLGIVISIYLLIFSLIKKSTKTIIHNSLFIILTSFLIYFLSQAFLFCKWTRFVAPIFAFFPIFAGVTLSYLRNLRYLSYLLVFTAIIPGIFFSQIYFRPDIRFQASEWIYKNIPSGSSVLFDTGNVVDIPITSPKSPTSLKTLNYNLNRISFDFYHLDENPALFEELINSLVSADYIFIPSRRIFANHLRFPNKYPKTAKYYQLLFSGELGFEELKTFYPFPELKISSASWRIKFQIDDERSEETFTVFDHPVIRIYKNNTKLTKDEYQNLFF